MSGQTRERVYSSEPVEGFPTERLIVTLYHWPGRGYFASCARWHIADGVRTCLPLDGGRCQLGAPRERFNARRFATMTIPEEQLAAIKAKGRAGESPAKFAGAA